MWRWCLTPTCKAKPDPDFQKHFDERHFMTTPKTGILLLNLGGPDNLDAVEPFLMNLFCDPEILELPFSALLQKPIATLIVKARLKKVQAGYRHMGGRS